MPAYVNLTAPPLPSICSPNTAAAGEDGIHRRGWHPERQPARLPVLSTNTVDAWRMEFKKTEGTREGCRLVHRLRRRIAAELSVVFAGFNHEKAAGVLQDERFKCLHGPLFILELFQ